MSKYLFHPDFESRLERLHFMLCGYFERSQSGFLQADLSSVIDCLFKVCAYAMCRSFEVLVKRV